MALEDTLLADSSSEPFEEEIASAALPQNVPTIQELKKAIPGHCFRPRHGGSSLELARFCSIPRLQKYSPNGSSFQISISKRRWGNQKVVN